MSTLQDRNVSWKNVPTRTIAAGGVEYENSARTTPAHR
jgi:hypothetical protein